MMFFMLFATNANAATLLNQSFTADVTDVVPEPCSGDAECRQMAEETKSKASIFATDQARSYCIRDAVAVAGAKYGQFKSYEITSVDFVQAFGMFRVTGKLSCMLYE